MACDIRFFIEDFVITNETSAGAADGEITVLAVGSTGGTKKYNLGADFDYDSGGQTSGTFTGLVAGLYTVYARSSTDCMTSIELSVFIDSTYAVRYTNQYYSLGPTSTRTYWKFEILQRDYTGDAETIQGKAFITWGDQAGEDPFIPVIPSQCRLEILSTEDEKFLDLYTDDEREFKVVVYTFGGIDWIPWWTGYVLTGQYTAPYDQLENYTVTVLAADMLENLNDIPFGTSGGSFPQGRMSILGGIVTAIRHTDIELQFVEGVQFVVTGVSDSFDDTSAIDVVYFDPDVYNQGDEPASCFEVLSGLLKSLNARIYQASGRWNIESITLKVGGTFNVRAFDANGASLSYGATYPRLLIRRSLSVGPRLCFMDRSQQMKIAQTYGTVNITYDYSLDSNGSLLISDGFVDVDIDNGQLEGWEIDKSLSGTTITPVLIETSNGDQTFSSLQFNTITGGGGIITSNTIVLNSEPVHIGDPGVDYKLRISFEVYMEPYDLTVPTYFDYYVAILDSNRPGDEYVLPINDNETGDRAIGDPTAGGVTYLIDDKWTRVWVDTPNVWQQVTFDTTIEQAGVFQSGDLQISFRFGMNKVYDYESYADLRAEDTLNIYSTQNFDNRRKLAIGGVASTSIQFYELEFGTDAESVPDIIRPDDYGGSNTVVWRLKRWVYNINVTPVFRETWFGKGTIRNVFVQYLPDSAAPQSSETKTAIIRENTRFDLDVEIKHADLPVDTNYQNITKGWLSFSDDSPTETWSIRTGTSNPTKSLIDLLADMYRGQYSEKRWKLTGTFDSQNPNISFGNTLPVSFFNTFWEVRTGKVYIPTFMMVDTKNASVDVELIETLQGDPVTDNTNLVIDPVTEGPEPPDPAAGRVHSDIFSEIYN